MNSKGKIVASHQPHFFPWLGYFDKMAKSDIFLLNDIVQIEKKSPMTRNKVLTNLGQERYISVAVCRENLYDISNSDVELSHFSESRKSILGILKQSYGKSPYFMQIMPLCEKVLSLDYTRLIDLDFATIAMIRNCFEIRTPIIKHSQLGVKGLGDDKTLNIILKCEAAGADIYLSGIGAKKYMELDKFSAHGLKVVFQQFDYPVYPQMGLNAFVPNLSALDMLFNCGIEESRRIFWENVRSTNEFGE